MTASIVLPGLAANDPVPGVYLHIAFAQGPASGDSSPREVLLMGNKTADGSATVDTVVYGPDSPVPLQTEEDAIALFGPGSDLHRQFRRFTAVNQVTTLRAIAVTESAGANATGTITLTTTATGNGTLRIYVGDEFVDTAIATGDDVTTIATAAVANINAMTHWAVTAGNALGVITLTAKNKGPRGNTIRYMARITSGIGTTTSATTDAAFTGGTTADSNTAALATILAKEYYRIAPSANDATQVGALASQVSTQALPTNGILQRVFVGSVDTLGNTTTFATGVNNARVEVAWQENSLWTPGELAANMAAVISLFEDTGLAAMRCNFAGFGNDAVSQAAWKVPAQRDQGAHPTRNEIKTALNNGYYPIAVNPNGSTYLVNRITSRSLSGAVPDYRIRDSHKVTICDFFGKDLKAKTQLQHAGKKLANDPPQGGRVPGPTVVTPSTYKPTVYSTIDDYDGADLLQNVEQIKAATVIQRETTPPTRLSVRIPLQTVDIALQFGIVVDQVA